MALSLNCDWCGKPITADSYPTVTKQGTENTDYCDFACVAAWSATFVNPDDPVPERVSE